MCITQVSAAWSRYQDKAYLPVKLMRAHMSHIFAFALGMFVATYGVAETVLQLDKAIQRAKIIVQENVADTTNR
jgi:hypothetical protein